MQLVDVDVEPLHGAEHQPGQQAGPVRVEEPGQHPPDPVVIEQTRLARAQPEQGWIERCGPFAEGVDRLAVQHQVGHHGPDRGRRGQLEPGVGARQVLRQQGGQPEPVTECVDDRQRPEQLRVQLHVRVLVIQRPHLPFGCWSLRPVRDAISITTE